MKEKSKHDTGKEGKRHLWERDYVAGKLLPFHFVLRPLTKARCLLVFWVPCYHEHLLHGSIPNLSVGQNLTHLCPSFQCDISPCGRPDPAASRLPWGLLTSNPLGVPAEIHTKALYSQPRRTAALSGNCYRWSLSSQETNLLRKANGHRAFSAPPPTPHHPA